jgi:hypothetical protein
MYRFYYTERGYFGGRKSFFDGNIRQTKKVGRISEDWADVLSCRQSLVEGESPGASVDSLSP